MNVVIVGATRGIGRAVARLCARRGDQIFLLGRGREQLQASANDLAQRGADGSSVGVAVCDLERPEQFGPALDEAQQLLGRIDAVVVTAGLFATQDRLEQDLAFTQRMLTVNFAHTVVFCEHARQRLLAGGGGTLCVVSSVAGERGRKPVVLYGASKAGLSAYLEGLDHKHRADGLKVVCVKPGFVKTGMTEGLDPPPFAGTAQGVAADILAAIDAGKPVLYTPRIWALVMLVIRWLPRFVMRRIGF